MAHAGSCEMATGSDARTKVQVNTKLRLPDFVKKANWMQNVLLRTSVLLGACGILYLRMPLAFVRPQFWAEDGMVFLDNRLHGIAALKIPAAGYLFTIPRLVGFVAGAFPIWLAPWIYNYAALAAALFLVGLVTSPRFDMPYKPLLALAVVVAPGGYEVFMNLINSQWLYAVGVAVILNMRAPETTLGAFAEYLLAALVGLTGPFSIFLCPVALALYFAGRERRLMIFSVILAICAIVQTYYIVRGGGVANVADPVVYSSTLWITIPAGAFTEVFSPANQLLKGYVGVLIIVVCVPIASWMVFRSAYRKQILTLAAFALFIIYSGMIKRRGNLATLGSYNNYVFAGQIFFVWFVCCAAAASRQGIRVAVLSLVAIALAHSAYRELGAEQTSIDYHWPDYAQRISQGGPVIVPINPTWGIKISADDSRIINLERLGVKPD